MIGAVNPTRACSTAYYRSSTTASLATVVAPASNTKGVIVYGCGARSGSSDHVRIMAKSSAPSAWDDSAADTIWMVWADDPSPQLQARSFPFVIPPGKGLYEQPSAANHTTAAWIDYEVVA